MDAETSQRPGRLPYVWDYDIDEAQFRALLAGSLTIGRLDQRWAAVRLLEYAPYREVVRLLGFRALVDGWPRRRRHIRSTSRRRGFDFLVEWLPQHRPDLLCLLCGISAAEAHACQGLAV